VDFADGIIGAVFDLHNAGQRLVGCSLQGSHQMPVAEIACAAIFWNCSTNAFVGRVRLAKGSSRRRGFANCHCSWVCAWADMRRSRKAEARTSAFHQDRWRRGALRSTADAQSSISRSGRAHERKNADSCR
jgi:hypothetical protein